ncbi:hypothetical protein HHK36_025621 [Tetracentron sinense]|uniref:Uncharacterized protein n=1 Tax=Tetracentron sinense TaxID=13715 RepID=A0A835D376_TETSI|nr:hypothetical protein HHK36_025621 [Tetracentron sinense]
METPLHEACREGHVDAEKFLMEDEPWVAYKINLHNESVFFVACERGQFDVVKHLLNYPRLFMLEDHRLTTSPHVAVSTGHTVTFSLSCKQMVAYPVHETGIDVNAINCKGFTALEFQQLQRSTLLKAGCKRCNQLPPGSPEIQGIKETIIGKLHENSPNDPYLGSKKIMNSSTNYHSRR